MAVLWQSGPTEVTDEALVAAVDAMHFAGEPPLGDSAIALLGGISKAILASPKGRAQPQYVALGFVLRSAFAANQCRYDFCLQLGGVGSGRQLQHSSSAIDSRCRY